MHYSSHYINYIIIYTPLCVLIGSGCVRMEGEGAVETEVEKKEEIEMRCSAIPDDTGHPSVTTSTRHNIVYPHVSECVCLLGRASTPQTSLSSPPPTPRHLPSFSTAIIQLPYPETDLCVMMTRDRTIMLSLLLILEIEIMRISFSFK